MPASDQRLHVNKNFRLDVDFLKKFYRHYAEKKKERVVVWDSKGLQEFNNWKLTFLDLCERDVFFRKKVNLLYKLILSKRRENQNETVMRYNKIIKNYSQPLWALTPKPQSMKAKGGDMDRKDWGLLRGLLEDYSKTNIEQA